MIKDIVNRELVNLTNCDQEPIHIPGSIQPHGCLLALDIQDFSIAFCSGNVEPFFGYRPEQLLAKGLAVLLDETQHGVLKNYIAGLSGPVSAPLQLTVNHQNYTCSIHRSHLYWILEFEPVDHLQQPPDVVYDQTVKFVQYLQQTHTLQELCAKITGEIKQLTGYDRVMVYRFDKDYNGEVFAESKRDDLESFLGLHYPHTDIPVQARQLYIKNLLRLITDMEYQPVPIYTIDDAPDKNLDLSLSVLRSVSPIHVQYLQNMGVGATLTISLLHEGKLWGLIACHHYSKKWIDHHTRINAQLQGHFLTSQINVRQQAEEYAQAKEVNVSLESLLNQSFVPERASLHAIVQQPQLLQLCNAGGVAILLEDELYKAGTTPADSDIQAIATWAGQHNKQGFFSSSKLADAYAPARELCIAAGIIFYALSGDGSAGIIWFNPETLEEVHWGGDPEKAIIKDEKGLHPRRSFETWKQVIKCQARKWTAAETTAATSFAYALQKHVSLIRLGEEDARQRALLAELKEKNAELENINWISTHDLKEPLRKIQVFSSRLLEKEAQLSPDVSASLVRMNRSANRMQTLIADLTAFNKLRNRQDAFAAVNLQTELQKVTQDLEQEIQEKGAAIHNNNLPVVKGVPVLLHQLFENLIRNALKFSKPGAVPEITLAGTPEPVLLPDNKQPFYKITITDNGIGFDNRFSETIFKVFNRLHARGQYEGSGIGLALCKKIMEVHKGHITAEGQPGAGAVFTLYFPVL